MGAPGPRRRRLPSHELSVHGTFLSFERNNTVPAFFSPSQIQLNTSKEETSMSETRTLIGYAGRTVGREELALVPTPPATEPHRPVPHHEIVKALIETGFATSESSTTNMRSRRMV
jgi:hypothetical protein